MHLYDFERRQQQPAPPGGGMETENGKDTSLPTYIWVTVILFVFIAASCGICARRKHQRQFLHREAVLNSHRPTLSLGRNPYAPPWAAFSRPSAELAALRPPPRARRRGSQASVTSLPVYMENPGAREVVLLQRTAPKEVDEPTTNNDTTTTVTDLPQTAPVSAPSGPVDGGAPPLPGYEVSQTTAPVSPPPTEQAATPQPANTHHPAQS